MVATVKSLLGFLVSLFRSRSELQAEILALRHQVNVLRRSAPRCPKLGNTDRLLFICLYRLWPGVLRSIIVVQPETVVRWHRQGFKAVPSENLDSGVEACTRTPGAKFSPKAQ